MNICQECGEYFNFGYGEHTLCPFCFHVVGLNFQKPSAFTEVVYFPFTCEMSPHINYEPYDELTHAYYYALAVDYT